jgi:hypothetical protein
MPGELAPVTTASDPVTASLFLGISDEVLLEPLRESAVSEVKFNHGGSSISLRIELENGARAAFKPKQTSLHSVPHREVAAYRINRLLGLSAVAPAFGRTFSLDELLGHLRSDSVKYRTRLIEQMTATDGQVVGAMMWWIPVIKRAKVDRYEIDSTDGIVTWQRYLAAGSPIPHDQRRLVAQISDMTLFDFIINNPDRWSGGNTRVSEDGLTLYFMDNTLSFGNDADGHGKVWTYFTRVQKFSRGLVSRLRHLDDVSIRAALDARAEDAFGDLLEDEEVEALLARRDRALDYIDGLIETHGVEAVLVFP